MTPFYKYNYFKLSIIDDNVENVFKNFKQYLTDGDDNFKGDDFKSEVAVKVDFDLVCNKPELDYNGDFKFMLFEPLTNPDKTVFFSNLSDGWYTAVYNYARLFKKDIYQIGLTTNKKLKQYPAYFFVKFFYNDRDEFQQRVIHLIKENSWTFYENSEKVKPLEIETIENYSAKRKIDRLNNEIIFDYMKKAGFDLTGTNFFKTNENVYYCKWK